MLQSGRREYDAARLHRTVFVVNPNHGSAADDVVDLLLLVRLLRIDATSREDVQAEAERGCTEEFKIDLAGLHALPVEVGEFEGVHRVATLSNRASWSQGSPNAGRTAEWRGGGLGQARRRVAIVGAINVLAAPCRFWVTRPQGRAEVLEPDLLGDEEECALRDHLMVAHPNMVQPETRGVLLKHFAVTEEAPPAA